MGATRNLPALTMMKCVMERGWEKGRSGGRRGDGAGYKEGHEGQPQSTK